MAAFLLVFAIYFPILGRVLPGIRGMPLNLVNYGMLIAIGAAFVALFSKRSEERMPLGKNLYIAAFIIYLFFVFTLRLGLSETISYEVLQLYRDSIAGLVYAGMTLIVLSRIDNQAQAKRFVDVFSLCLVVCFLIQGVLSIFESYRGEYLIDYAEQEVSTDLYARDVLVASGMGGLNSIGLKTALTGMMGQHNRYGSMLIYCNLVFLIQFLRTKKNYYLAAAIFALFLAIGNTTKTGILASLVVAIILFLNYQPIRWLRPLGFILIVGGMFFGLKGQIMNAIYSTGGEATMFFRSEYWAYFLQHYFNLASEDWSVFLLGMDYTSISNLSFDYDQSVNKSFESDFLLLLFRAGIVGLLGYLFLIVGLIYSGLKKRKQSGVLLLCLAICLMLSSVTLDLNTRYFNSVLIVFIWFMSVTRTEDYFLIKKRVSHQTPPRDNSFHPPVECT